MGRSHDDEGNALGPIEYENIVKERYIISKRTNTSYLDTAEISVHERKLLLKYIQDEIDQEKKYIQEQESKRRK